MNIGVLTGGGDCPGLNPVIHGVVRTALKEGHQVTGVLRGWQGMLEKMTRPLDRNSVSGILPRGGTILHTSRTNPYKDPAQIEKVVANFKEMNLDALIAIGGDDTLGVANKLYQDFKLPTVGVPKTIDNDLSGTDCTFGFDTAINIAMDAIDRLHSTAESHDRVMVIELMGRHAGWIALEAGLAGGADMILIPEVEANIDEVVDVVKSRHNMGKNFSIIVVAEGATLGKDFATVSEEKDAFGHVRLGGIGNTIGYEIEKRTGYETRVTVLGHVQRGGSPTAFDRFLGMQFGVKAVQLVGEKNFGQMVAKRGNDIIGIPLVDAVSKLKTVGPELYETAKIFFG